MKKNPKYSDSVNALNGCLGVFSQTVFFFLLFVLAPYVGFFLLCWWVIAWILGLLFPVLIVIAGSFIGGLVNLFKKN